MEEQNYKQPENKQEIQQNGHFPETCPQCKGTILADESGCPNC